MSRKTNLLVMMLLIAVMAIGGVVSTFAGPTARATGAPVAAAPVNSSVVSSPAGSDAAAQPVMDVQEAQTSSVGKGEMITLKELDAPQVITADRAARHEAAEKNTHLSTGAIPVSKEAVRPSSEPESVAPMSTDAPTTLTLWRTTALAIPTGFASDISEPSVAMGGKNIFYTNNWYGARSTNGGVSFTYFDPSADFVDFCCDQDTLYDRARDMFLWYRQGSKDVSGNNVFKLGVSTNGGASFCTYTISPNSINSAYANTWLDYPHLDLSNDFLYISSNRFNASSNYVGGVLLRYPLDSLRACAGFSYSYQTTTGGTWTTVQGATDIMYVGQHVTTSSFRVYKWPESTTAMTSATVAIAAWASAAMVCTDPSGFNPCARADSRPLSGFIRTNTTGVNEVGWYWNASQGANRPFPHGQGAVFRQDTLAYYRNSDIWSSSYAWVYPTVSPNARGDIGLGIFLIGGGFQPRYYIGIADSYTGGSSFIYGLVAVSTTSPGSNTWGDYIRVRPAYPGGLGFIGSGYRSIVNGSSANSQEYMTIFSRGRDQYNVQHWWDK